MNRLRTLITVLLLPLSLASCTVEVHVYPDTDISEPADIVDAPDLLDAPDTDIAPFQLLAVSPKVGTTDGGEVVTILGTGIPADVEVHFGDFKGTSPYVEDGERILVMTPSSPPGPVDVRVVASNGEERLLEDGYHYEAFAAVFTVSPPEGPREGGTAIEVEGEGFTPSTVLLVDGKPAIGVNVINTERIHAITPGGTAGPVNIQVTGYGGFAELTDGFRYLAPPSVQQLTPWSGTAAGGTLLTLTGNALGPETEVFIGGELAEIVSPGTGTQVTCVTPGGPSGPADLLVTTADGDTVLSNAFTYTEPSDTLTLLNATPSTGDTTGGTMVHLTLVGQVDGPASVVFGDAAPLDIILSTTTSTLSLPAPPAEVPGAVTVSVIQGDSSSALPDGFTYVTPLLLSSLSPSEGELTGGDTVLLEGTGFLSGPLEVRFGPLPASSVDVITDTTASVETPPGSPGSVDVTLRRDNEEATLPSSFTYLLDDTLQIYGLSPTRGAMAGDTFVEFYGTGFQPGTQVFFGEFEGLDATVHSPVLLSVRSPRNIVTTVDIRITSGEEEVTLPAVWSYYNPASVTGGTWGGPIDGSVNVAVLDATTTQPVPEATIILEQAEGDLVKIADENGHATFSFKGMSGPAKVSAAAPGYSAYTVAEFDGANVTLYIFPSPPPGPPGPPPPGAQVHGKVFGMDKYILVPPADCDPLVTTESSLCAPCEEDTECSDLENGTCADLLQPGGIQESRCSLPCVEAEDCPLDMVCGAPGAPDVCHPRPPKKAAYCQASKPDIFTATSPITEANYVDQEGYYLLNVGPGQKAIVCHGGFIDVDGTFHPTILGLRRQVFPELGNLIDGQDVQLEVPLTRTLRVRLIDPPPWEGDPLPPGFSIHMSLGGGDGVLEMPDIAPDPSAEPFLFNGYPDTLTGPLQGAAYQFYTTITGSDVDGVYFSQHLLQDVATLNGPNVLDGDASGVFTSNPTPGGEDLSAVFIPEAGTGFAVGPDGALAHQFNGEWWSQSPLTPADLHALWGSSAQDVWAVGESGVILHFNGTAWQTIESPTTMTLRGIWGAAANDIHAVGDEGILHFDGTSWTPQETAHAFHLTHLTGSGPTHRVATGEDGKVLIFDGNQWVASFVDPATSLMSAWTSGPERIWVVGSDGSVFSRQDFGPWEALTPPTTRDLHAVWGSPDGETVLAAGDAGTLLQWKDGDWSDWTSPENGLDIRSVSSAPEADAPLVAVGIAGLRLGPFMPFPRTTEPLFGGVLGDLLAWLNPDHPLPHFTTIILTNSLGIPFWQFVVEPQVSETSLPDFAALGVPIYPGGLGRVILSHTRNLDDTPFDIDAFINMDFDIFRRVTWSVSATDILFP